VGKQSVKITVTDNALLTAFTVWKFTVVRPNSAPKLLLGENLSILGMETKPLHFKFNATDAEGDALTFSVDTGMFNIDPVSGEFNFTPPKGTAGSYRFNVTVKDTGGLGDTRTVTLVIAKLPSNGGDGGGVGWLVYLLLIVVVVICIGAAVVLGSRIRRRSGGSPSGPEKERYEAVYGAGTYEYAKKGGSSSLREFREAEKQKQAEAPLTCPSCGSDKVQKFPDGGAICNQCGKPVK
jgi:ribosomal protein L37AE/L43A